MLLETVVYFYKSNITDNGDRRSLTHTLKWKKKKKKSHGIFTFGNGLKWRSDNSINKKKTVLFKLLGKTTLKNTSGFIGEQY